MIDRFVVKRNLCLECGACESMCPVNCISTPRKNLVYTPTVDHSKCTNCGICLKSCPGFEVDFNKLSKEFLEGVSNWKIGTYYKTYLGFSKNSNIRKESSSGGIITSICSYLLNSKKVDGVVVVKGKDKITNEVFIAKNEKELLDSLQSKYLPTPICLSFKDIINSNKKYVFVGSPCHIHSLRKVSLFNKKLRENIYLTISHFCEYNPDPHYLKFIAEKTSIDFSKIKKIKFREGNWPGNLVFYKNDGSPVSPFKKLFYPVTIPFIRKRCLLCVDHTGELADISVGDAWSLGLSGEKGGWSVFLSRNSKADKIITEASKNYIKFNEISYKKIIKSQQKPLEIKKNGYILRKAKVKYYPHFHNYEKEFDKPSKEIEKETKLLYFAIYLKEKKLINKIPKFFFDFYLNRIFSKIKIVKDYEK
jgi:coenzyme F420 hydrogenase subunit beta